MASSSRDETHSQDKTPNTDNREEKLSKNKKTLAEGKVLRKKIRHLRREDERQAKSLTQDLKDIRESLSDVNNLNQIQKLDRREFKRKSKRNDEETEETTRTTRKYEEKATNKSQRDEEKTIGKRCNNVEESCATSSSIKQKTTSPSRQRKTVRFADEEDSGKKQSKKWNRKQNEAILSLSGIDLK